MPNRFDEIRASLSAIVHTPQSTHRPKVFVTNGQVLNNWIGVEEYDPSQMYVVSAQGVTAMEDEADDDDR